MPLEQGYSDKTRNKNIGEMLSKYKKTGMIGNTTPKDMAHATKIASAAAYGSQRKNKKKKKKALSHSTMPRKSRGSSHKSGY